MPTSFEKCTCGCRGCQAATDAIIYSLMPTPALIRAFELVLDATETAFEAKDGEKWEDCNRRHLLISTELINRGDLPDVWPW